MSIIWAILIFCILIISHEFGHFIVAKLNGIYVYDFNLGMGPKIFSFKAKETEYTLRLFPIGGAVRMMGEDESADDPRAFNQKSVLQRMSVVFAGPLMNFIMAIIIFVIVFMGMGMPSNNNVVGKVLPEQPAALAGLLSGDTIQSINGQKIENWTQMIEVMQNNVAGKPLEMAISRDGQPLALSVEPYFDKTNNRWMVGIIQSMEKQGLFTSIGLGVQRSYELTKMLLMTLVGMIAGDVPVDLAGPVGVVSVIGQSADIGIQNLLILTGFLCINLGVINLLPLPALDGSRLVFLAVEGLRGKPIDPEKEGKIHFIGLLMLFALMIFVTYQDILRLIE